MISIIEFRTEYRTGKDPVDWVLIAPKGEGHNKTQTWHRVNKLRPPEDADDNVKDSLSYHDMSAKWTQIGPAYEAWKSGNALPEDGTPLAAWSGVSPEQAAALKAMGIKTVEDVRDMGDGAVSNLRFPNARQLPKLAGDYLSGETAAEKDARMAEMQERMKAMEELLEEATSKPKRGRPKKEPEAA